MHNSQKHYCRKIIYYPGNSGLKKTKYEIDQDFNPITNGTIVSVRSLQQPKSQSRTVIKKNRIGTPFTKDNNQDLPIDSDEITTTYRSNFKSNLKSRPTTVNNQKPPTLNKSQNLRPTILSKQINYLKQAHQQQIIPFLQQDNQSIYQFINSVLKDQQITSYNQSVQNKAVTSRKQSKKINIEPENNVQFVEQIDVDQIDQIDQKVDQEVEIQQCCEDKQDKDYLKFNELEQLERVSQDVKDNGENTQRKIEQILKEHPDYLKHSQGKCKCFTCSCLYNCQCNFKKLLINFTPNYGTVYRQSYQERMNQLKNNNQNQLIDQCYKSDQIQTLAKTQTQKNSQNRKDYHQHPPQQKTAICKPVNQYPKFNSHNLTNYKLTFNQFPTYQQVKYKDLSLQPILSQEPIQKESNYQDAYKKKKVKEEEEILNSNHINRKPFSDSVSFGFESQNVLNYKGKSYDIPTQLKVHNSIHLPQGDHSNLLKTTYQNYGQLSPQRCK